MIFTKHIYWFSIICIFTFIISCGRDYYPKPRGYYRIDFPEKKYLKYKSNCPFNFEFPQYAKVNIDNDNYSEPCWLNIDFPEYKGRIHISYKIIDNNISQYLEDSRTLAYKHTIKAEAINEKILYNDEKKVYGILYDLKGNVASSVQFFLTDSTNHFLRGALYFYVPPNKDSLAPVIDFFREDILHLIETFEWK